MICDRRNWHDRAKCSLEGEPIAVVTATGSGARLDAVEAHRVVIALGRKHPIRRWTAVSGCLRIEVERAHAPVVAQDLHHQLLLAQSGSAT